MGPRWKNGIFPWENGILSAHREECQPSYVPQSPSGDFAGVSILPESGMAVVTGWDTCAQGKREENSRTGRCGTHRKL